MFNEHFHLIYAKVAQNFPPLHFLSLQAVAIVGCVAILLLYRGRLGISFSNLPGIGLVMGLACFLIMAMLHDRMQSTLKPLMVLDFIFVAGLLGGWRNVLVALVLVAFSRYTFGGAKFLLPAVLDYVFIALASLLAHSQYYIKQQGIPGLKSIVAILVLRVLSAEASFFIVGALGLVPHDIIMTVLIRRAIGSCTVSALIIVPTMLLIRQATLQEQQFFRDPVSGLPNRRELERQLREQISNHDEWNIPQTMLLVKLDNITLMTQSYGYAWVEKFFAETGQHLLSHSQRRSLLAYSPQLFYFSERGYAILLRNVTKAGVQQGGMAASLLSALTLATQQPSGALQPVFSISVVDISLSQDFDVVRFLRSLSLLRENQPGGVCFVEATLEQQITLNEYILTRLAQWGEEGGVPVWLQPKVLLDSRSCYGAEALLRVPTANGDSYINPHSLLLTAEDYNKRQQLEWGIVQAVVGCLDKMPPSLQHLQISVNLTPDVFNEPGFGRRLHELLDTRGISRERLVVEVIETSRFAPSDVVQENIAALVDAGIKLSLDDFGTAYASISLLSRYHFRELKLDYSMISNIDDPRMREAIAMSIDGARRYDASIVAEGIETEAQRKLLLTMGVQHGQGFLFGRAMPFDNFVVYAQGAGLSHHPS